MKKTLFREERLRLIMEIISEQKSVIVNDLAEQFEKSPGSIRLDLAELESRGLISRTHGGAILADDASEGLVLNKKVLQLRGETKTEEKQRIGKAVADLVHDGDSIMIDGGTTTYFVAKNLHTKRDLTIITTSIHLFPVLWEIPDATIYLSGGVVHRGFEDMYGEISLESIGKFKPDHTIIGIDGVSVEYGITATEPTMAMLKRSMVAVSKNLIVVADSSKFGKVCLLSVADVQNVNSFVTDTDLTDEEVAALSTLGPKVLRA